MTPNFFCKKSNNLNDIEINKFASISLPFFINIFNLNKKKKTFFCLCYLFNKNQKKKTYQNKLNDLK
jgi:hypothetical protein